MMKLVVSMLAAMMGAACAQTCSDLSGDEAATNDAFDCSTAGGTVNSAAVSDATGDAATCCDIDCAGSWSACTAACEAADDRTWTSTTAPMGGGTACPDDAECVPPAERALPPAQLRRKIKAVTQALEVAVIERAGSELDSEPDLTICWVCLFFTKTYEHEHSKVVKHW